MTANDPKRRLLSWVSVSIWVALFVPIYVAHDYPLEVRMYVRSALVVGMIGLQIYMTVLWHRDRAERREQELEEFHREFHRLPRL